MKVLTLLTKWKSFKKIARQIQCYNILMLFKIIFSIRKLNNNKFKSKIMILQTYPFIKNYNFFQTHHFNSKYLIKVSKIISNYKKFVRIIIFHHKIIQKKYILKIGYSSSYSVSLQLFYKELKIILYFIVKYKCIIYWKLFVSFLKK